MSLQSDYNNCTNIFRFGSDELANYHKGKWQETLEQIGERKVIVKSIITFGDCYIVKFESGYSTLNYLDNGRCSPRSYDVIKGVVKS